MNTEPINPSEVSTVSRPWYLTGLAVILIAVGVILTYAYGVATIQQLSEGSGFSVLAIKVLLIHAIWFALILSGIGIWRGKFWARITLIAALISLFIITLPSTPIFHTISKLLIYGLIGYSVFTNRSKAYFASRNRAVAV